MIALVTGANGCIGFALLQELIASGQYRAVRGLVRNPAAAAGLPCDVQIVIGDLFDTAALRRAVDGADAVFHCAAKVHDADGAAAEFDRVNIEGTRNLLAACSFSAKRHGRAPRFVHFSTVAVYGESTPADGLPESAPTAPATPYARSKCAAEALVAQWGAEGGAAAVNLRVATVYGPRDRGNVQRMIGAILRRRYVSIAGGRSRKSFVAVRNVAHAARLAISPAADAVIAGRPFVVADARSYRVAELELSILNLAGIIWDTKIKKRSGVGSLPTLPFPLALGIAATVEGAVKLFFRKAGRSPITAAQVRRLAANTVYQMEILPRIPGYTPVVSLERGMTEAMEWYRQEQQRKPVQ